MKYKKPLVEIYTKEMMLEIEALAGDLCPSSCKCGGLGARA